MAGNSFGTLFRFTTWGESHGPAIGVVVDGVPPRLPLASPTFSAGSTSANRASRGLRRSAARKTSSES